MNPDKPKGPPQERRQGDGKLAISFNAPVTEDDKLLLEALMFAIYGPQARLDIEQGTSDDEVVIRGNQFQLKRIGDALHNREWKTDKEMASKVDGYVYGKKYIKKERRW